MGQCAYFCVHVSNKGSVCVLCTCTDVFSCCVPTNGCQCVLCTYTFGGLCVWHVYAQVCLHENSVFCVHACMWRGSMCMFASTWCLCMSNGVHDCKGKACVVGQCVLCLSVTVGGSVCLCMLPACIALCGIVCVVCITHVVWGSAYVICSWPSSPTG